VHPSYNRKSRKRKPPTYSVVRPISIPIPTYSVARPISIPIPTYGGARPIFIPISMSSPVTSGIRSAQQGNPCKSLILSAVEALRGEDPVDPLLLAASVTSARFVNLIEEGIELAIRR
jgi:hypothetical protein